MMAESRDPYVTHDEPIGARIDAARRRLTRAQQRAREAAQALEMAQKVVEESDVEIACIERELRDLEAALAPAPMVPAEIRPDCVHSAQLQQVLNTLQEDSGLDPYLVSLATAHSAQLVAEFQCALKEMERQRGPQEDPRKMRGKQLKVETWMCDTIFQCPGTLSHARRG